MQFKNQNFYVVVFALLFIWANIGGTQTPDSIQIKTIPVQQIQLNTSLEQSAVPMNGVVVFKVELSWNGDLSQYQVEPLSQPILTNLLLEGSGSENRLETLADGGYRAIKAISYRLKPLEMGMAYIDGMVIKYRNRITGEEDQLSSQRVMVEILEPVDDGNGSGTVSYIYIVLISVFLGAIFYFVVMFFRKRRQIALNPGTEEPLPEKYLNKLAHEVDPRGTNLGQMTGKLSVIFREYLSMDFNIPARGASTQEIIKQLETIEVDETDRINLKMVFEKLDLIKFAGKNIDPADFTNIYGTIEAFLLKRKQLQKTTMDQL